MWAAFIITIAERPCWCVQMKCTLRNSLQSTWVGPRSGHLTHPTDTQPRNNIAATLSGSYDSSVSIVHRGVHASVPLLTHAATVIRWQ